MIYQERLLSHLVAYKHSTLGVQQPGIFNYRGTLVDRHHILPVSRADLNLLPLARGLAPPYLRANPEVVKHRYFHHLNSSQAFAFNLFLPFFSDRANGSAALLRSLGQGTRLRDWKLEAIPDAAEGTNLDALWVTDDDVTTICEVKLSEAEFGKARNDDRHRTKLLKIYQPMLDGLVDAALLHPPTFFDNYQILRNIWHLARLECGRLVFLLPRANNGPWIAVNDVIARIDLRLRSRISILAIEDVLSALAADPKNNLQKYSSELVAKYIP